MSLIVLTGPVRSGKSSMAERLAASRNKPVVVAASGWDGDAEMRARIAAHRESRPGDWTTIEAMPDPSWIESVSGGAVLVVDCLGTLVSHVCYDAIGDAEVAPTGSDALISAAVEALTKALIARDGDTIVVTNEAGWGLVPVWPSARAFRDELGRANRRLVDAADAAYLVVDGRCIDLAVLPQRPEWPRT